MNVPLHVEVNYVIGTSIVSSTHVEEGNPAMLSHMKTTSSIFTDSCPNPTTLDSHMEIVNPCTMRIEYHGNTDDEDGDDADYLHVAPPATQSRQANLDVNEEDDFQYSIPYSEVPVGSTLHTAATSVPRTERTISSEKVLHEMLTHCSILYSQLCTSNSKVMWEVSLLYGSVIHIAGTRM